MAWVSLKKDARMGEENQRMVYMVEEDDISNVPDPDYAAVGSIAFTADMTGFWVKDGSGQWSESTADALALIGLI